MILLNCLCQKLFLLVKQQATEQVNIRKKSQDKVDYHHYPSGKEIMKALNGNDVVFADSKGVLFQIKRKSDIKRVHSVVITWKHQKQKEWRKHSPNC